MIQSSQQVRRELGLDPKPRWGFALDPVQEGVWGGAPTGSGAEPQRGLGGAPTAGGPLPPPPFPLATPLEFYSAVCPNSAVSTSETAEVVLQIQLLDVLDTKAYIYLIGAEISPSFGFSLHKMPTGTLLATACDSSVVVHLRKCS